MFLIRQQQLAVIQQLKWGGYLTQFVALVRDELGFAVEGLNDEIIRKRIEYAHKNAGLLNITDEPNINVFIYASFPLGELFWKTDNTCKIFMSDTSLSEWERTRKLEEYLDSYLAAR